MADPNDYSAVPQPNGLFKPPQPNYNPLGSGNPNLDMLFALIVPQMLGQGKFLPQQFPAQGILDQYASSKYMQASRGVEMQARAADKEAIYGTMLKVRSNYTTDPLTGVQAAQLQQGAGLLNSMPVQMLSEMLLGPQMSEDIFFGRKGSKARLARGIGRMGFSRADSLGGDSMSGETMQAFSDQIYNNLYGPGTNINDISGFSAGRVGDIMNELSQRGLLPESTAALNSYDRRKAFRDKSLRDPSFSSEINDALDRGDTVDELTKLEGGADAVRKIDANRVTNTLKGYTDAIASVREIFGDNGMGNAPMGQLMAAMEALTQNSMNSMSPGKVENIMRRMQMASRDSGVSLESLMGLTARSGALADQYGLSRSIASENVIGAMERSRALRDTGGFTPGFGRMDPTKAAMFALDQGMRADASGVGRLIGVANRIVEENKNDKDFTQNRGKNLIKMVEALKRGDSTYFDEGLNKEVNIYEQMGNNPGTFFNEHFDRAEISRSQANAYYRDSNTQEFMIANRALHAQAAELKQNLAANFAGNSGITDRIGNTVPDAERGALQSRISQSLATSLVDTINTTMTADERINVLQSSMQRAVQAHVRETNPGLSEDQVMRRSKDLMIGAGGMFKNDADLRDFLATQQGEAGVFVEGNYNMKMGQMQQMFNLRGLAEARVRQQRNLSRAAIFDADRLGDGSNVIQRFVDSGGNPEAMLGIISDVDVRKQFYSAVGGGTDDASKDAGRASMKNVYAAMDSEYRSAVDADEDVIKKLASGGLTFDQLQERLVGGANKTAFDGKTKLLTTAQLADNIKKAYGKGGAAKDAMSAALESIYGGNDKKIAAAIADGSAYTALAELGGIREYVTDAKAATELGLTSDTMTEAEARRQLEHVDVMKDTSKKSKIEAYARFGKQLETGVVTASGIVDLFGDGMNATARKGVETSIEKAITDNTDKDKITDLEKQLKGSGLSAERQQVLLDATKMARAHKVLGGLTDMSDTATLSKVAAIQDQITAGAIPADSEVARVMREGTEEEKRKLVKEPEKLEKTLQEEEAKRTEAGGKSTKEIMETIEGDAAKMAGASGAADPTGIGSAIASTVGPAIGDAIKSAFDKDFKIETATINNVTMPSLGDDIVKAISSVASTATSGDGKSGMAITGVLKMVGVDRAVLSALPKDNTERTPAGPPVREQA
jgi:hypothetical protein